MILLTNPGTADKLQLTTSSAANIDVHCSYMDHTITGDNVEGGRQNTAMSSPTTTDIVAGPASGLIRNVKTLHIRNRHASSSCDVTVIYDVGGTDYQLHSVTLRSGEMLSYVDGVGFFSYTAATNPAFRAFALASDDATSSATPNEVTGLSQLTGIGSFAFHYRLMVQSTATTTGHRFSVNHDGTVTQFAAEVGWMGGVANNSDDVADQDFVAAGANLKSYFQARAKSTAGWGTWTDVDTAGADIMVTIDGHMTVTVDGNIELWHGSEVAAASVVKAKSGLILMRLGD
jgi:hypothetical protein